MDYFALYAFIMAGLCAAVLLFIKPLRRAIHGPDDILSLDEDFKALEALAEAMASIGGNGTEFRQGKNSPDYDQLVGHYEGYMSQAEEVRRLLEKRGFTISSL